MSSYTISSLHIRNIALLLSLYVRKLPEHTVELPQQTVHVPSFMTLFIELPASLRYSLATSFASAGDAYRAMIYVFYRVRGTESSILMYLCGGNIKRIKAHSVKWPRAAVRRV